MGCCRGTRRVVQRNNAHTMPEVNSVTQQPPCYFITEYGAQFQLQFIQNKLFAYPGPGRIVEASKLLGSCGTPEGTQYDTLVRKLLASSPCQVNITKRIGGNKFPLSLVEAQCR